MPDNFEPFSCDKIRNTMDKQSEDIKVPSGVKNILLAGEQVLASVRQSRLKEAITPDTIVITTQRVIRFSPSAMGLRKEIEDYRYEDMANYKVNKGIMFATVTITNRFMNEDLILDDLPKGQIDHISRIIQDRIRLVKAVQIPGYQTPASIQSEDPLSVLKLRLARGEITKEEFAELKKLLG
jgi:hypothetical protein